VILLSSNELFKKFEPKFNMEHHYQGLMNYLLNNFAPELDSPPQYRIRPKEDIQYREIDFTCMIIS